jgi:hypothetical protein
VPPPVRDPQLEAALVDMGLAATRVDPQRADLDRAGTRCRRGCAPEDRLDSCDQGTWVERLRDVVVGVQLKPDDRVDVVGPRGQHEDGGRPAPTDLATDLEPVDDRQRQVQDHEVRVVPQMERQRRVPVAGGDHGEALFLEVELEQLHDVRLVVDEDAFHGGESTARGHAVGRPT